MDLIGDGLAKVRREWPAALAVAVLVLGHVWLGVVEGQTWRPIGPPLFAAAAVFILGELYRKVA